MNRNFYDFREFDPFSRKFLPGKKLNLKIACVFVMENFLRVLLPKNVHFEEFAKVLSSKSESESFQNYKLVKFAKFRGFLTSRKFLPLKGHKSSRM